MIDYLYGYDPNASTQTTIVENLGWRPLNSFGSIFPSVMKTFPKQMFALVKKRLKTFPLRTLQGTALFALPARVALIIGGKVFEDP